MRISTLDTSVPVLVFPEACSWVEVLSEELMLSMRIYMFVCAYAPYVYICIFLLLFLFFLLVRGLFISVLMMY